MHHFVSVNVSNKYGTLPQKEINKASKKTVSVSEISFQIKPSPGGLFVWPLKLAGNSFPNIIYFHGFHGWPAVGQLAKPLQKLVLNVWKAIPN
jgi:hypothetical protein